MPAGVKAVKRAMIKFQGELSPACQDYILKREALTGFISGSIVFCIGVAITVVLAVKADWAYALFILLLAVLPFAAGKKPAKKAFGRIMPQSVIIADDMLESEGKEFHCTRTLSQVKKVIDRGDWYHICFYYPYRNPRFICQKDLIKEGTIEEFEAMFADKMKRKV